MTVRANPLPSDTVELIVTSPDGLPRRNEPVTCGIPWPRSVLRDAAQLHMRDAQGQPTPLQTRVLDRWPDGSVRWVLLDWQATVNGSTTYRVNIQTPADPSPAPGLRIVRGGSHLLIETAAADFQCDASNFPFASVTRNGQAEIQPSLTRFHVEADGGQVREPLALGPLELTVEEEGPLRCTVRFDGQIRGSDEDEEPLADFIARLHFFAGSATVRFEITLRNSRKADHPGGLWDLGNGGSIYLRDASLTIALAPGDGMPAVRGSAEPGIPFENLTAPVEVYQDSSGGENWKSTNHLNRRHEVPNTFRGYRLSTGWGQPEHTGLRATPVLSLTRGEHTLSVAMSHFWQNFPKAMEATHDSLTLHLFPRQYADVHEIQGGEQKTSTFYIAFGPDTVTEESLAWVRQPLLPHTAPAWYCNSGALPYLTPKADDPHTDYLQLVDAAIDGDDTFVHKREVVDEYGWRHFGDIYGDHEAIFHKGPTPLVSHYNNQYDPVAGFAYQFLRSSDPRWWAHMQELAWHVIDIDIYHTDKDKTAYNHGLFWHTYHYVDADTGTHRSYPKAAKVCGGGPADEQNYATGLTHHHFLTGSAASKEAAIGLARFVIDIDDGNKTIFRWLDRGYTGLASQSRTPDYHGPGRGAANSLAALLDGHRLTGDPIYLNKAEQLIRRVIHPADNVPARNLLDAENRWFYTMFLQSLGKYLDYKAELGQLDAKYAYARASLLHYVHWMADREYPYLEKPEILEYPTETWVAQDMRKSEIFKFAARHARGAERERFLERAEFFFRYSTQTLKAMKTRTLARPVVLLLSYGFMHAYFHHRKDIDAPEPTETPTDWGKPEVFVPQKVRAKKRAKIVIGAAGLALAAAVIGLVIRLLR